MKKLITISILFVCLMLWIILAPNYSFAAIIENNPTVTNDSNYHVLEMFHSLDNQLGVILENSATTGKSTIFSYLSMAKPYLWYIDNTNENKMYLAFYNESTPILGGYTIDIYNNNNSKITVDGYQINTIATFRVGFDDLSIAYVSGSETHYVPAVTYNYFGDSVLESMRNIGWIGDGASLSDIRSGLSTINSSVIQEGNETQNAINSSGQATQNAINSSGQATQNAINTQTQQQQSNFDNFTNTTYYDNTVTNIDTQDLYGNITDTGVDDFLFRVYDLLTNGFSTRTRATTITIPMPYNMDPIILDSTPVVNFYNTYSVLGELITLFWTFVFGVYYVRFAKRIFTWLSTGEVLNVKGFMKQLNDLNANITKEMM